MVIWTVAEPGRAFADAALWLARKTEASVAVILPLAAEKSPELDGITYGEIFNTVYPSLDQSGNRSSEKRRLGSFVRASNLATPASESGDLND